jgi:hypothetical protein
MALFYTPMKKILAPIFISLFVFSACHSKDEAEYYYSNDERDTLLTNVITYVSENAVYADLNTRFEKKFRAEYVSRLPLYHFVKFTKMENGECYFLLSRPVAGLKSLRRGVVGKFTLKDGELLPTNFEEVVNTPHFSEELVVERGTFLFQELIKKGNLSEYVSMKHYVEWPDKNLQYDKKRHTWVATNLGIN